MLEADRARCFLGQGKQHKQRQVDMTRVDPLNAIHMKRQNSFIVNTRKDTAFRANWFILFNCLCYNKSSERNLANRLRKLRDINSEAIKLVCLYFRRPFGFYIRARVCPTKFLTQLCSHFNFISESSSIVQPLNGHFRKMSLQLDALPLAKRLLYCAQRLVVCAQSHIDHLPSK